FATCSSKQSTRRRLAISKTKSLRRGPVKGFRETLLYHNVRFAPERVWFGRIQTRSDFAGYIFAKSRDRFSKCLSRRHRSWVPLRPPARRSDRNRPAIRDCHGSAHAARRQASAA